MKRVKMMSAQHLIYYCVKNIYLVIINQEICQNMMQLNILPHNYNVYLNILPQAVIQNISIIYLSIRSKRQKTQTNIISLRRFSVLIITFHITQSKTDSYISPPWVLSLMKYTTSNDKVYRLFMYHTVLYGVSWQSNMEELLAVSFVARANMVLSFCMNVQQSSQLKKQCCKLLNTNMTQSSFTALITQFL